MWSFLCSPLVGLTRPDVMTRISRSFAAGVGKVPVRTLRMYINWVRRLAVIEFADELVLEALVVPTTHIGASL